MVLFADFANCGQGRWRRAFVQREFIQQDTNSPGEKVEMAIPGQVIDVRKINKIAFNNL